LRCSVAAGEVADHCEIAIDDLEREDPEAAGALAAALFDFVYGGPPCGTCGYATCPCGHGKRAWERER
jgi:hypothetical protein